MNDTEKVRCKLFYDEMTLDRRINALRSKENFKYFVPEEESHTICLWLVNEIVGFYSVGKIVIDDMYLLGHGAQQILEKFKTISFSDTLGP